MRFKPNLSKYSYPSKPDEHMITVKHIVDTNFNEDYNYYNNSFWYHLLRFFANIIIILIMNPFMFLFYGLKIEGRENVKEAKKLKTSVMTISNHVFFLDYVAILCALRPKLEYFMAWPINFEGPLRGFIKLMGGVPIPQKLKAIKKWESDIDNIVKDNHWLHVYPEGSMWFYYDKIRPLKKGCFKIAYKHNMPILPMSFSYRPRKGIFAWFNKDKPLITLRVGKLMYVDQSLDKKASIEDIQKRAYHVIQTLAGIYPNDPDYYTINSYLQTNSDAT